MQGGGDRFGGRVRGAALARGSCCSRARSTTICRCPDIPGWRCSRPFNEHLMRGVGGLNLAMSPRATPGSETDYRAARRSTGDRRRHHPARLATLRQHHRIGLRRRLRMAQGDLAVLGRCCSRRRDVFHGVVVGADEFQPHPVLVAQHPAQWRGHGHVVRHAPAAIRLLRRHPAG